MASRLKTLLLLSPTFDQPKRTTPSAPKIARQLSKLCRVVVLCGGEVSKVEDRSPSLRIYYTKERLMPDPFNVGFVPDARNLLERILRTEKPDAVLNLKHSFPINTLVHDLKRKGFRIVTTTDTFPGYDWWTASWPANIALWVYARLWPREVLRASDRVILFHEGLIARAKKLGLPYQVIPNGVELEILDAAKPQRLAGKVNVIYVGRLESVKGYETMFAAMQRVVLRHPEVHFYHVGDEAGKEDFKRRYASAQIHFVGRKSLPEVYSYLKGSQIVLLASRSEGLPNALMEGMAAGCAPLSTAVGAVPWLLEHGKLGRTFAWRDVDALVRHVEWLLAHPRERALMGKRSAAKIRRDYNWSRIAKQYYDELFVRR